MTDDSKIVDLRNPRAPAAPTEALPVPIAALKATSQRFLTSGFSQVLEELDDALFELADEANAAKDQQRYFDAMHEVRVRRQEMQTRFEKHLERRYSLMLRPSSLSAAERGQAKLRVLESDALEELVALEGMSKRAERRFTQEIWTLCTAWQHCISGPVVAARDLPMGPANITQALAAALDGVTLDIKAKLVMLKLFERRVLDNYGDLCQALVPVLQAHGLPSEFKAPPKNEESRPRTESPTNEAPGEETRRQLTSDANELANRLFDTLEQLLATEPGADAGQGGAKVPSKPSLMVALQDMQNEQYARLNVRGSLKGRSNAELEAELAQQLMKRLQQVSKVPSADASALSGGRDRDTIQFVGTLFQYILDGDVLPRELKPVIGRLQIPILKMAMLDKNFFSQDEHPARKLLSGLLGAGIGWSPSEDEVEKDPLYRKVEEIVMRVLRDFGVDTQVFVDAYDDFMTFNAKDRRRAELLAKRAADAAGGRAMAEQARAYINAFLDQRLARGDYPAVVANILKDGWSRVLFLSYVREGRESARLAEDLKTAERLLWSVEPVGDASRRAELIDALPALVEALRDGFNRASMSAFETSPWFEQLERLHLSRLARPPGYSSAAPGGPAQAPGTATPGPSGDSPVFVPTEEPESELDEETQGKVAALRVGNWVDFRQDDGKMMRCRLAAVINGIGKYIFVNRAGIKVAELDKDGLVAAIQGQRLYLIEDGRLFDRALESVISNLRDMKNKPLE